MRSQVTLLTAAALLFGASSCLLPGRKKPESSKTAGFFQDYTLLREAEKVRQAYVNPAFDLRSYKSVRIPDFSNYSGGAIDPAALQLAAEALTAALEAMPPTQRPFQLIDRSPATASAWVDLILEGAITRYEVKTDSSSWSRLSDQAVVAIECRLVDRRSGQVVALIQHRTKENISEIQYENPIREAMRQLGADVAAFLSEPELGEADEDEDEPEARPSEDQPEKKKKKKDKKKKEKKDDEEEESRL